MAYKRYANPTILLDQMLQVGRFSAMVTEIIEANGEQKAWEYYLAKVDSSEMSFNDFKERMIAPETKEMTESDVETTVNNSLDILNGLNPSRLN